MADRGKNKAHRGKSTADNASDGPMTEPGSRSQARDVDKDGAKRAKGWIQGAMPSKPFALSLGSQNQVSGIKTGWDWIQG